MHNDVQQLRHILKSAKTIAVVGLSAQWHRPSFFAAKYMQEHGYKIIPVNPRYAGDGQHPAEEILGQTCYASLLDIPEKVDMVDVFRKAEDVLPIAQEAFQNSGRQSVTNRCVKIEHARIFGGLNWVGVNTGIISAKRPV